jgi:hypothetical protein
MTYEFIILLGVLAPIGISIWLAFRYTDSKLSERRNLEFEHYHRMINELVRGRGEIPLLHEQIACIYEIRRMKRYWPVSIRILTSLKNNAGWAQYGDLMKEVDLTLKYMTSLKTRVSQPFRKSGDR